MSLTYDQRSEIRMAFDEAYVEPERRRAARVKHQVDAEIVPWKRNRAGVPFTVTIEDFSPTGVGVVHTGPLPMQGEFVVKIPRPDSEPLAVLLTVVRNRPQEDGKYTVGMEISNVLDRSAMSQLFSDVSGTGHARVAAEADDCRASRRRKILFLVFGIFGIVTAMLIQ